MGAVRFEKIQFTNGDAKDAFHRAQEQAYYDYGHGGYTGTIAEKKSFRMVECDGDTNDKIQACYNDYDHFVNDKWDACGCIEITDEIQLEKLRLGTLNEYNNYATGKRCFVFFGTASC